MTKFMKTIRWPVLRRYFRKLVEIVLKDTKCVPIMNFYFRKMLSVFEIFVKSFKITTYTVKLIMAICMEQNMKIPTL